jgi:predicted P-loop ATPase
MNSTHGVPLAFDELVTVGADPKLNKARDVDVLSPKFSQDDVALPFTRRHVADHRDKLTPDHGDAEWKRQMIVSKEGTYKAALANAITLLRHSPEWRGVLAYNEFSLYTVAKKPAPWPQSVPGENWTNSDDTRAADWLQHQGVLVNSNIAAEAVQTIAKENTFHPVRDYLNSLVWDQEARIDFWLRDYLGAVDTPFARAIGARWMISGVARIKQPGCQADHVLLVEGPQGIRKSTSLRVLAGDEWFSDHISDLGSKDSRLELHGKWILEMAELDKVRRSELERVKAFLTAREDNFRPPYGRRSERVPRSCVFAGSVNDQTPLTDETGNRRFWPVRCGAIDINKLVADRDQLWAEAYKRFLTGEVWWLDSPELTEAATGEQEERYAGGPWDEVILAWLEEPTQRCGRAGESGTRLPLEPFDSTRERVTITDVLLHAIGKPLDRFTQMDQNSVQRCLVHAGWKRRQCRVELSRKWFYVRPGE